MRRRKSPRDEKTGCYNRPARRNPMQKAERDRIEETIRKLKENKVQAG